MIGASSRGVQIADELARVRPRRGPRRRSPHPDPARLPRHGHLLVARVHWPSRPPHRRCRRPARCTQGGRRCSCRPPPSADRSTSRPARARVRLLGHSTGPTAPARFAEILRSAPRTRNPHASAADRHRPAHRRVGPHRRGLPPGPDRARLVPRPRYDLDLRSGDRLRRPRDRLPDRLALASASDRRGRTASGSTGESRPPRVSLSSASASSPGATPDSSPAHATTPDRVVAYSPVQGGLPRRTQPRCPAMNERLRRRRRRRPRFRRLAALLLPAQACVSRWSTAPLRDRHPVHTRPHASRGHPAERWGLLHAVVPQVRPRSTGPVPLPGASRSRCRSGRAPAWTPFTRPPHRARSRPPRCGCRGGAHVRDGTAGGQSTRRQRAGCASGAPGHDRALRSRLTIGADGSVLPWRAVGAALERSATHAGAALYTYRGNLPTAGTSGPTPTVPEPGSSRPTRV